MRRRLQIALPEQEARSRHFVPVAPLLLLVAFSLAVKTANSSADFQIDQRWVLQELRRQIEQASLSSERTPDPAEDVELSPLREVREVVRKGDTFGSILRRIGINASEISRWTATTRNHASLSRLQPGRTFTFLLPSGTDRLAGLQYEVAPDSMLVMREEGDEITAQVERLPRMVDVRLVSGTIESNLYLSATRLGVPESVISTLVDIFGWEIDFTADLQPGDTFRLAYEEHRTAEGRAVPGGRLLAAELGVLGKNWQAVYFEADDDGGNYYSPEGRPFGRSFLRYPVEFTRISSQFTSSRFHPILRLFRPHRGVDFAAAIGTPIRAVAAGRVECASWKGGFGRVVKIDHGSGLESFYAHMSSIARDVRAGSRVQMGQVIGRVGASGLATGPHLHYAMYRDGVYVNPMTVKLPASPLLAARFLSEFNHTRDELLQQLASAPMGSVRLASTDPTTKAN